MDEAEVISRCQKQDVDAFELIYRQYHQSLLRTAIRMLKQRQDAEDAVQTTFVKLYNNIANFKFQSKFGTYLFRILLNTCFDALTKKKKTGTIPLPVSGPSIHTNAELRTSIEMAIENLPTQMRACFVLFAVEEFKQKEIARIMDLSIGGVKANIYQAKCRLRAMLSESVMEAQNGL